MENKIKVKCLSCGKEVEVEPIPYGNGEIATCSECGGLAYNNKKEVPNETVHRSHIG